MHKIVKISDLYPIMEEMFCAGGILTLTVTGMSMHPMLRHQRDTVVLEPVTNPLHVNDVVLYRRESGQFVLHRIVGIESNGDYVLCGDNQFTFEHNIGHRQMIGRLQAFNRQGRHITCVSPFYKAYVYLLPLLRFLKHGLLICRRFSTAIKGSMHHLMIGNR